MGSRILGQSPTDRRALPNPPSTAHRRNRSSETAELLRVGGGRRGWDVPTALWSELIGLGATVRALPTAAGVVHRAALPSLGEAARFVRNRDLSCCFPGCDRRPNAAMIDHTVPHGVVGPPTPVTPVFMPKTSLAQTSGPDPRDRRTSSSPTGPSYGSAPPATATEDHRAAGCTPALEHPHTASQAPPQHGGGYGLTDAWPDHAHPQDPTPARNAPAPARRRQRNQEAIDEGQPPYSEKDGFGYGGNRNPWPTTQGGRDCLPATLRSSNAAAASATSTQTCATRSAGRAHHRRQASRGRPGPLRTAYER